MGSGGQVLRVYNGTSEVCVFCHTPHHANASVSPAPIWNRANSATAVYKAYGTTLAGSNVSAVGSVSLACLSCHDGVTAFDSLVNPPGDATGIYPAGQEMNWRFMMPGGGPSLVATIHKFDTSAAGSCVVCHEWLYGLPAPVYRLTTGVDLTNSHPVSITYNPAVSTSLRPKSTVLSSIDLVTGLNTTAGQSFGNNLQQNRWAVKGFISNTATIQDLLRNDKVECSSCHDPHFKNLSWDEVEPLAYGGLAGAGWCGTSESCGDGAFLRRVGGNTGSAICRTCHTN
ncbi:hypothetical protein EPN18_02075 [bacterium]|nr:MAG: hypothetical protein EPN18_02075 [bacterium]